MIRIGEKYEKENGFAHAARVRQRRGWRMKRGASTLLPEFWDVPRVKEEIAFALWKAGNPTKAGNYTSYLSNNVRVEIIIRHDTNGSSFLDNVKFFEY